MATRVDARLGDHSLHDGKQGPVGQKLHAHRRGHSGIDTRRARRPPDDLRPRTRARWSSASAPPVCSISETTLCGDKAELVDYDAPSMGQIPPRKAKTLMVTGAFSDNTYVATVTVQVDRPRPTPAYARDADAIS